MIVNIHEAKTHFSQLISKFLEGEEVIVAKNGKPVLKFAAVQQKRLKQRPLGFLGCEVDMSCFDDPIPGLEDYQ